jgi:hypothetical protein
MNKDEWGPSIIKTIMRKHNQGKILIKGSKLTRRTNLGLSQHPTLEFYN